MEENKNEISFNEIENKNDIILIDLRDEMSFLYGNIPNSINIQFQELENFILNNSINKKIVLYCKNGEKSSKIAKNFSNEKLNIYYLKDGYMGWLKNHLIQEDISEEVEKSIRKKFHKNLFSKFASAINKYELVKPNDKIAVCISGGKDSMLMAKLFQELKRHNKFPFEIIFLVMDPGYSKENRKIIEHNAKILNIPITIFETNIFENVFHIEKSPCYICARMRRGHLYNKAKELGCNKIALGHHYDDVIETIIMGMLYSGQIQTMMPKLHSTNFEGMELIRPMYLIREDDIKHWRDYHKLHFIQCACKFTDICYNNELSDKNSNVSSTRLKVKNFIRQIKNQDPQIEGNIFKSVENVNLETIIAYKDKTGTHHFLDEY